MIPYEQAFTDLQSSHSEERIRGLQALTGRADARVLPAILPLLEDAEPLVRRHAIMTLSSVPDPIRAEAIARQLRDAHPQVRRRVCAYLIKFPHEARLVEPLMAILGDDKADLAARDYAAMTLASGQHRQSIPLLVHLAHSGPPALWRRIVHCLFRFNDPATAPALAHISTATEADAKTRAIAVRALAMLGQPRNPEADIDLT